MRAAAVWSLWLAGRALASPEECASRAAGTYCVGPPILPVVFPLDHTILTCPEGKRTVCRSGEYCGEGTGDPKGKEQCRLMSTETVADGPLQVQRCAPAVMTNPGAKAPQRALCSPCVQLGGQALNILLNYLLNAGVVQGCQELCGQLGTKGERTACDLVCGVVGIRAFIKALNRTDLDPIFFCEEIHACPMGPDNSSVALGAMHASPTSVAKGDTVALSVDVAVKVASGVGEFRIKVDGPVTQPVSASYLLPNGLATGSESLGVKLTVQDDESGDFPVIWRPGSYRFTFEVCQGECGSKHPHSKVFGKKSGNFTLKEGTPAIVV